MEKSPWVYFPQGVLPMGIFSAGYSLFILRGVFFNGKVFFLHLFTFISYIPEITNSTWLKKCWMGLKEQNQTKASRRLVIVKFSSVTEKNIPNFFENIVSLTNRHDAIACICLLVLMLYIPVIIVSIMSSWLRSRLSALLKDTRQRHQRFWNLQPFEPQSNALPNKPLWTVNFTASYISRHEKLVPIHHEFHTNISHVWEKCARSQILCSNYMYSHIDKIPPKLLHYMHSIYPVTGTNLPR